MRGSCRSVGGMGPNRAAGGHRSIGIARRVGAEAGRGRVEQGIAGLVSALRLRRLPQLRCPIQGCRLICAGPPPMRPCLEPAPPMPKIVPRLAAVAALTMLMAGPPAAAETPGSAAERASCEAQLAAGVPKSRLAVLARGFNLP